MVKIKCLILFFNGFEDTEGIATRDILIRAGVDVISVSDSSEKIVTTSKKLDVFTNLSLNDIKKIDDYKFLVIPGGNIKTVINNKKILKIIKDFNEQKKDIYAICAAPCILEKVGLLNNKHFTCYPGFEKNIKGLFENKNVVIDKNIITSKSMFYSFDFAFAILKRHFGIKMANKIKKDIKPYKNIE
ncbi:MAG: DJ-1/PfpI family protein [Bacilli bacterium]|nr:DJ-1/PfpI family protein [Bacilli bacterium]